MIEFPIPKKYIKPLDSITKELINNQVNKYGVLKVIENHFIYLDCTRVRDGLRLMQTIGHPYIYTISCLLYLLNTYVKENDLQKYYDRLDKLHKANIEYEKNKSSNCV